MAVKKKVDTLRREVYMCRDIVAGVDVMQDPSLFDLKVMHNSAQRARTAAVQGVPSAIAATSSGSRRTQRRSSRGGEERPRGKGEKDDQRDVHAKLLHEIGEMLDKDVRSHCNRMGMPFKFIHEPRLAALCSNMSRVKRVSFAKDKILEPEGAEAKKFFSQMKFLFNNAQMEAQKDQLGMVECSKAPLFAGARAPLLEIAEMLLTSGGSLRPTLEAMDIDGDGKLSMDNWEGGLELLGYSGDGAAAFRELCGEGHHNIRLADAEDRLMGLLVPHGQAAGNEEIDLTI